MTGHESLCTWGPSLHRASAGGALEHGGSALTSAIIFVLPASTLKDMQKAALGFVVC